MGGSVARGGPVPNALVSLVGDRITVTSIQRQTHVFFNWYSNSETKATTANNLMSHTKADTKTAIRGTARTTQRQRERKT